jgi:hypothetical protein
MLSRASLTFFPLEFQPGGPSLASAGETPPREGSAGEPLRHPVRLRPRAVRSQDGRMRLDRDLLCCEP